MVASDQEKLVPVHPLSFAGAASAHRADKLGDKGERVVDDAAEGAAVLPGTGQAVGGVREPAEAAPVAFRVLDAWCAAKRVAELGHETAEALYAAYWLTTCGDYSAVLSNRDRALREVLSLKARLADLELALGDFVQDPKAVS